MARLINAETAASGTGDTFPVSRRSRDEYRLVQVDISAGTPNVTIQGRVATDMPWVEVIVYTASGADAVAMFPEMRAIWDTNTGTISVELDNV